MADDFGRRLLADLERETCTLDKILLSLASLHAPGRHDFTNVAALDELADVFMRARPQPRPEPAEGGIPPPHTAPPRPPIIQLGGIGSASGKTQLLYLAAARCLLGGTGDAAPEAAEAPDLPHQPPGAVAWFDLQGTFSPSRLLHILEAELSRQQSRPTVPNIPTADPNPDSDTGTTNTRTPTAPPETSNPRPDSHIKPARPSSSSNEHATAASALSHVHVFQPTSTPSLTATLDSLPAYLLSPSPSHSSQTLPLRLVIISSLSTFWWQDRHEADAAGAPGQLARPSFSSSAGGPSQTARGGSGVSLSGSLYHERWRALTRAVRAVQAALHVPVLVADTCLATARERPGLRGEPAGRGPAVAVQPHLPPVWEAAVTARLLLRRRRRRWPVAAPVREVLEEERGRRRRVEEGGAAVVLEADVLVNLWGCDDWSRATWDGVERWRARRLVLRVSARNVLVQPDAVER